MPAPHAFLSYTRIDDEFHGGPITELRKLLELGVRVVTGDCEFTIFQDVEGIELGQQWQKRIAQTIDTSTFLIPVMTPLFFRSEPCRDEVEKFLAHERSLARDDLVLPIYYVTAPVLEKPDLCQQDRLASTMSQRQRYDFRQKAGSLGNDPTLRQKVKSLAEQIAAAIERTASNVAKALQPAQHGQYDTELRTGSARISQQRSDAIAQSAKIVLWVDDRPENNLYERQAFHDYGVDFELATSTEDALFWLQRKKFDAIISDMGRPPDLRAGYTLLSAVRMHDDKTPFFIYAGSRSPQHVAEARSMGAQGTTNRPEELIAMVLQALSIGQSR